MEHECSFYPVELFEARVTHILSDCNCLVFVERLGQSVDVSLAPELHGALKNDSFLHTFYKPEELKKNLSTPAPLRARDKVLIHFSPGNKVVRWQRCSEEAIQQRA